MIHEYVHKEKPAVWEEDSENCWKLRYPGRTLYFIAYLSQPLNQFEIGIWENGGFEIDGRYNNIKSLTKRLHELGCGFVPLPKSLLEKRLVATE